MYFSLSLSVGFIIAISSSSLGFLLLCLGFLCYALKDQSSNYVRLSRAVSAISQIKLLRSNSVEPLQQENDEGQPIHLTRMSDNYQAIQHRPTLPEVIIAEDEYGVKIKRT